MKKLFTLFITFFSIFAIAQAQRVGIVQGAIIDKATQETLIGVSLTVEGTTPLIGTTTDENGKFQLKIPVGSYNIKATYIGYKAITKFNVVVTTGNANITNYELDVEASSLGEVEIKENRSIKVTTVESPNSIQRLSTEEIKTSPGGNFDIFKVVQTLPGVGNPPTIGNRNDIVVRGGAPGENVYFLDGVEIPVINHFATQGSGGGSNGILNVSFVEELTLSSSAFDAKYDNALSSVFQFKQRDGNSERIQGNIRGSISEAAATFEGPLGKNTTFLASTRRSFLQYFFKAINLPIRPDYWDFQTKITHKINPKTTLTFIGLGAIDNFFTEVGPNDTSATNAYILKTAPVIKQWNYTNGLALKRLLKNGFLNVALSRNMADNTFSQYEDGLRNDVTKRYSNSVSREIENKLRIDVNQYFNDWKISYGVSAQYVKYSNDFNGIILRELKSPTGQIIQPELRTKFNTAVNFLRYGAFGQVSRRLMDDKLGISFGVRTDMNTFTDNGSNPLPALSPRASASYTINKQWKVNASIGQYAKLPAYTILGFKDNNNNFVNKDAKYIKSVHYVAGTEFIPRESTRFTLEGFYKTYSNYPTSVRDGGSLANQGADFGFIGNEDILSNGKGRAYGAEFFFQQKLKKNFFMFLSATYAISEFSGTDGKLIRSAWDNQYLLSTTIGRKFRGGWEMGLKFRVAGGTPYTPFDLAASRKQYVLTGRGVLDKTRINSQRLGDFKQFDFRLDKKWNFKRTTFDVFLDVTNAFVLKNPTLPDYVFERKTDGTGFKTTDGKALAIDGSNGVPKVLKEPSTFVNPSIGLLFEF